MSEIWKDIEGYEGIYQVSDLGAIKSLKRKGRIQDLILKLTISSAGYVNVNLCNGSIKNIRIHRLVALHFIPNLDNKATVNHKWGNKLDNRAIALEWATQAENNLHSFRILGRTHKSGKDNPRSKSVSKYSISGELIETFGSKHEAEIITGITRRHISRVCMGTRKTAGGYIWK